MKHNNSNRRSSKNHNRNNSESDFLSKKTLYNWKKNTAIEIEYLVKDKRAFYDLYLRNTN